ncbi:MAK10-like protein [Tanacetum coccineum]
MGDESPIRILRDYSKPSHEGYKNTSELPVGNNDVPRDLTPSQLWERTQLRLFQFFLRDQASNWLERLPAGSITTWEDLTTRFLAQFFPPGRTAKLRNDILMFQQHHGESLSEAWTRFKDLLQKVPHHGIDLWLQVQIFYDHVNPVTRRTIDQSAGGKLRDQNAKESWALLEDLALYDNESWNDPRDFAKPVKAIALPQDVPSTSDRRLIELENQVQRLMEAHLALTQPTQVNKITTSCEICSGPHDTQYCMEDPEQAFVEYASSRTDEAGGSNRNDDGIEWLDVEEPLDLVNTTNAYIDVDLPMNIMPLSYYNSIRMNGYEYMGRNFVGLGRDMHVFVGNMSYVMDFTILESIENNIDPSLSNVVFGRPFVKIACLAINTKNIMSFAYYNSIRMNGYEYMGRNFIVLGMDIHVFVGNMSYGFYHPENEDDYDRGCRKSSDLEDGFYRDTIKLGLEYLDGIDDEG